VNQKQNSMILFNSIPPVYNR